MNHLVARSGFVAGLCAAVLVAIAVPGAMAAPDGGRAPDGWSVVDSEDYGAVTYTGAWRVDQGPGDVGGTRATATEYVENGYPWVSTALVEFSGTRARVIAPTGPDAGMADVFVDYERVATIDQYSAAAAPAQVVFDTGRLPKGDHTIALVRTNEKSPSSSDAIVRFDALYFQGSASEPECERGKGGTSQALDVTAPPYSAAGDGVTNDRMAIQRALDDAAAAGGGTVLLPEGCTFLSGSLKLSSNTSLQVDGTLLQSQNDADYGYTPLHGHDIAPADPAWDHAGFHNLPLVYARNAHDVAVTGSGKIKLTQPPIGQSPIKLWPIGFSEVTGFAVRHVSVVNGPQFGITMFNSDHGVIANTQVLQIPAGLNTNAVTVENSQHVRVTGNRLVSSDDAFHISSSYADPRSYQPSWWSTDVPEPVHHIEIDHNDITNHGNPYCNCPYGKAIAFVAWGGGAPDLRDVRISDIDIHDNVLTGQEAIGCWCTNWYIPGSEQSPITNVRIMNNQYNGTTSFTWADAVVTDLQTDFGKMGSRRVINGDFENTGTAWWSMTGDAGATDAAGSDILRSAQARAALPELDPDGWVGYLQPRVDGKSKRGAQASLYEGLGLTASHPSVPFGQFSYELRADIVTSGDPVRLFAYDTCTGHYLASRTVTATQVDRVSLPFRLNTTCANVRVGIDQASGEADAWGLIDNMTVTRGVAGMTVMDDADPNVTYTGAWTTYPSFPADADWGGTHTTTATAGDSVSIPFTGCRAVVHALVGDNGGMADVYLDGTKVDTVDYYSPTFKASNVMIDTGEIAPGQHELTIVATGTKHEASTGYYINVDALFAETCAGLSS